MHLLSFVVRAFPVFASFFWRVALLLAHERESGKADFKETMSRRILHADMDAFYAAIEELDHPEWKSQPLVVGADPRKGNGRGVVSTCNYNARKYGIRSAMPVSRAYQLCPHAVFVPPRMERYMEVSRTIMEIFHRYSPVVEPLSLDEAFLDCSGTDRLFGDAVSLGQTIKNDVRQETGLTVSIGISSVKFVAKIASDLEKPDGLVSVPEGKEKDFLAPLPVERLWGAGPRTCQRLRAAGLNTIGDIADRGLAMLPENGKGKIWKHLYDLARAVDPRPVEGSRQRKSIGEERTFGSDISSSEALRQWIVDLCSELAWRIRQTGFQGRTVTVKFRYTGFETHTRSSTSEKPFLTERHLRDSALHIWDHVDSELRQGRSIRLLGVQVSHAVQEQNSREKAAQQLGLFDSLQGEAESMLSSHQGSQSGMGPMQDRRKQNAWMMGHPLEKEQRIESAMDAINQKFGKKLRRGMGRNL